MRHGSVAAVSAAVGLSLVVLGSAACRARVQGTSQVVTQGASALDLGAAAKQVDSLPTVQMTLSLRLDEGGVSVPATTQTYTFDRTSKRSRIVTKANAMAKSVGSTMVVSGRLIYAKSDTESTWTELAIDPSLLPATQQYQTPSGSLAQFQQMGLDLKRVGPTPIDGVTGTRYSSSMNWQKMVTALRSKSKLTDQFFAPVASLKDVTGTVTVDLDASGFPAELAMDLTFHVSGRTVGEHEKVSYQKLSTNPHIQLPAPADIGRTIPVTSPQELTIQLQAVLTAKPA